MMDLEMEAPIDDIEALFTEEDEDALSVAAPTQAATVCS
jgi:hypothetical protein